MINTTKLRANSGAALAALVYGKVGGNTLPAKYIYVQSGGSPAGVYSVLAASGASSTSHTDSGASTSGTAAASAGAVSVSGNIGALQHSWAYLSGDGSFFLNSASTNDPVFSRNFSGVANGTSSGFVTTTWRDTVTDLTTGANTVFDRTVSLQWTNTIPAYGPFTAGSPGGSSSGSGFGGPTFHDIADVTATASVVSGGPTSGSFSYSWVTETGSAGATLSGTTSATCNVHFDWTIPPSTSSTKSVLLGCTITDLVSGYSSTVHSVSVSRSFTNDT